MIGEGALLKEELCHMCTRKLTLMVALIDWKLPDTYYNVFACMYCNTSEYMPYGVMKCVCVYDWIISCCLLLVWKSLAQHKTILCNAVKMYYSVHKVN